MTKQMKGIDVSHHQDPKKLNYKALADAGYTWVIARATYGVKPDTTFVEHCNRAKEAGLLIGGYHFYRQTQVSQDQYEAFVTQLDEVPLDLVPVVDLEWNTKYDGKVEKHIFLKGSTALITALSSRYRQDPMLYLAPGFYQTLGNPKVLLNYPWWVAHYRAAKDHDKGPWCPFKPWAMWQWTGSGSLPEVFDGPLDLNVANGLYLLSDEPIPSEEGAPDTVPPAALGEAFAEKHAELSRIHAELAALYRRQP